MRLAEWVSVFNYYNPNTATEVPMEVNTLVRITQTKNKGKPRNRHQMNLDTSPQHDEDNPQVVRD